MDDDTIASPWERARSWLQATPAEVAGLALLLAGALVATGLLVWQASQRPDGAGPSVAAQLGDGVGPADDQAASHAQGHDDHGPARDPADDHDHDVTPATLVVHVTGAVATPGVVTLPGGSRVDDAITAAGGAVPDARLDHLNLARLLADGEHVHLPRDGEDPLPPTDGRGAAGAPGGQAGDPGGRIDLNHATAEQLQTLPGIGPSKAAAIVAHRDEHGPFAAPGDLRGVPGIGEKTFQALADLVTVS